MIQQGSNAWKISRLGYFTGSRIGELMTSGRKKEELFGQTAMSYIYEVAAERNLLPAYVNDEYLFEIYDNYMTAFTKYMEFGKENEAFAIERYQLLTGYTCEEVESLRHPSLKWFSASPDRIVHLGTKRRAIAEVKCVKPGRFMEYKDKVYDNATLKAIEPKYYYQVQAEMICSKLRIADFIVFCPFLKNGLHVVRIKADWDVQDEIKFRVREANKLIKKIIKK